MMEEIWKDIEGYEGHYQISNLGNVKSLNRIVKYQNKGFTGATQALHKERMRKTVKSTKGYIEVLLCKDRKYKLFRIHRLIAIHFIPNPNKYQEINHIDGNKANNSINNLEWSNRSLNNLHAFRTGLNKQHRGVNNKFSKPVNRLNIDGSFAERFDSLADTSSKGFNPSIVSQCCRNMPKRNTHNGYKWEFAVDA